MSSPAHHVDDATVWTAADFPDLRRSCRRLGEVHRREIEAALHAASASGTEEAIRPAHFPLPQTRPLLEKCAEDLERGPGFALLSGFPVDRLRLEQNRLAFCGLCSHLGTITAQTHTGERIIEVVDRRRPYDHASRGYHSNRLLPFHTDGAHCAALLCLGSAVRGGESVIVSAAAVHNAVLSERPDLWEVLARGFYHHRRGEEGPGEPPISPRPIPVFSFRDGLLHCMYNRNPIEWAEHEGARLSREQREALDYLDGVLSRPELQLRMQLRPGDIQLVANFLVLHSRTAYEDRPPQRRHLLRVWLTRPGSPRSGPTLLDLYVPSESAS